MKPRNSHGFTLIEIMIVLVIIGILAALTIPRYMLWKTRSEVKETLKQIYAMQRAYRQEFNSYCLSGVEASANNPDAFARLGIKIETDAQYSYTMVVANIDSFRCNARANLDSDSTEDLWTIDQSGELVNTTNDFES